MPTIKSAKKRLRQSRKRKERNDARKRKLKKVTKELDQLIESGHKEEAQELIPELMKVADRAASKGPLHKNKASRIKSKYMKRINNI